MSHSDIEDQLLYSSGEERTDPKEQPMEQDMPQLERVEKDEPPKIRVKKYTSRAIDFQIHQAKGSSGCNLCTFTGSAEEISGHAQNHFIRYFCACGKSEALKRDIITHIIANQGTDDRHLSDFCFAVSKSHFQQFLQDQGLNPASPFGELVTVEKPRQVSRGSAYSESSCRDIRLTMSTEKIRQDARQIIQDRANSGNSKCSYPPKSSQKGKYPVKRDESHQSRRNDSSGSRHDNSKHRRNGSSARKDGPCSTRSVRESSTDELRAVIAERDALRKENQELRDRLKAADRAFRRARDQLEQLTGVQRVISDAQAAIDCYLD